jgi:hypothetical protein
MEIEETILLLDEPAKTATLVEAAECGPVEIRRRRSRRRRRRHVRHS